MKRDELAFTVLVSSTRVVHNSLAQLLPPLIPVLAVALDYPLWQLGLLVTVYTFGAGMGQAPVGHLADLYDRRYILPTGFAVAGGSYLVFALAPRLATAVPAIPLVPFDPAFVIMVGSMFLVGVGMSVVLPTTYPLISENVHAGHKGKVLGVFGSAAKIGGATIPLVVGVLVLVLVWEEIVALLGLFGLAYAGVLFVSLRQFDTTPAARTHDTDEEKSGSLSGDKREYVYPLFVLYVFFITRSFASRGLRAFIPAFIVGVYGYTFTAFGTSLSAESIANFYLSALLIVSAGTQIVLGWVVDRYDARKALIAFMVAATGGILALAYLQLSPLWLLVVLFVVGAGIWGLNPARDLLISDISPSDREGRTFGYLWTASSLTGALIPTLVGYIADVFGLRQSFGFLALGTLLAAISILLLYSDSVYVETATGGETRDV